MLLLLEEITTRPQRAEAAAARLRAPGHVLMTAQIGPGMNRLLRASLHATPPTPRLGPDADIAQVQPRILHPRARGEALPEPAIGGIVTRRWFILPRDDVDELIDISTRAWTGCEADTAGHPYGLWRDARDTPEGAAQVMLMTHYPSLNAWEQSRYWKPSAEAQARRAEWGALFARRRAMLLDTRVEVWGVS
jgi:hypothetical protein